jgi:hypothetical protein
MLLFHVNRGRLCAVLDQDPPQPNESGKKTYPPPPDQHPHPLALVPSPALDLRCFCYTTMRDVILLRQCFIGVMSMTCILHMQWYAG